MKTLLATVLALIATATIAGTEPPEEAVKGPGPKAEVPKQRTGFSINGVFLGMTAAEAKAAEQPNPFLYPIFTYDNDKVIAVRGTMPRDERPLGLPDKSEGQQLLNKVAKSPNRRNPYQDPLDAAVNSLLRASTRNVLDTTLISDGEYSAFVAWSHSQVNVLYLSNSARAQFDELTNPVKIAAREAQQRAAQEEESRKAEEVAAAKKQADRQAKADEERKIAEAKRLEAMASVTGPMLCMIDGKSKPTLYLDLDVDGEFKLVSDGSPAEAGTWGGGSFLGQRAIILKTPKSREEQFPDFYTAYNDSIAIDPSSTSLTLVRRSSFPGSGSATAYKAVCVKAKSLTPSQAQKLTAANLKNNPLRPEAAAVQRQQQQSQRPPATYCTQLEDTYADRPALQKRLLAQMGCT